MTNIKMPTATSGATDETQPLLTVNEIIIKLKDSNLSFKGNDLFRIF